MFKAIGKYLKIGAVVILVSSLCLTSCAGSRKHLDSHTVEKAVQKTMKALKQLDLKTFNARTDNYVRTCRNWLGIPTVKEYKVFNELLQPGFVRIRRYKDNKRFAQKVMENLAWNVKEVREDGKAAQIDMEISNKDMSDVMGKYTIHLMEDII